MINPARPARARALAPDAMLIETMGYDPQKGVPMIEFHLERMKQSAAERALAIEQASDRVSRAAAGVRAIGAWRSDPAVVERISAMLPLIDSARVRVNLLADHASQRLSILASHGARTAPLTYGR